MKIGNSQYVHIMDSRLNGKTAFNTVGQNMVQKKNDKRPNKACQRGKKRQSKSLLLLHLSKKDWAKWD